MVRNGNGGDRKNGNGNSKVIPTHLLICIALSLLMKDGWLDVTRRCCVRLKISSHFFLGLLWLWFSNTALRNCNGKGSLSLGWKTLYDPAACRYVNTPSAYDTAVRRPTSCRYFSSLRMISRHAGFLASAELLVLHLYLLFYYCTSNIDCQYIFVTWLTSVILLLRTKFHVNQTINHWDRT